MRFARFLFALLAVFAVAVSVHGAIAQSPAVAESSSLVPPGPSVGARVATPTQHIPAPSHRHTLDLVALGAVVGATKKKATRRSAGQKRDVPMYLDSIAHVMRKNEDTGKMENVAIHGGVLVDDTDLTDEEIDELTALRAIRPATPDEIDRLERADADAERAELQKTHEGEVLQLQANQAAERAAAVGKNATPEQLSKLDEKHGAAMATLQEKQAKALAQ